MPYKPMPTIEERVARIEKGQDELERRADNTERDTKTQNDKMYTLMLEIKDSQHEGFQKLEERFDDKLEKLSISFDNKLALLSKEISGVVKQHNLLRFNVQKVATTVSIIVAVGGYLAKGLLDQARDHIDAVGLLLPMKK